MKLSICLCIFFSSLVACIGQTNNIDSKLELIDVASRASDSLRYTDAISKWTEVIKSNPVNGEYWCKLADAYYGNKQWKNAINAYQQTINLGFAMRWIWAIPIARSFAQLQMKDSSYYWIKKAIALGYPSLDIIKKDTVLQKYYTDKRFKDLLWMKDRNEMTRTEGWNYDLKYLWWQIQRIHYKPYTKFSKAEFTTFVDKIRHEIPVKNDLQLTADFMKLVAMVSDGHSLVKTWDFKDTMLAKRIPVRFEIFKEGTFIVCADSLHTSFIGQQILEIDHIPVKKILPLLDEYIGHENIMWLKNMEPGLLPITAFLNGIGVTKSAGSCTITLKDQDGKIIHLKLTTSIAPKGVAQNNYYPEGWKTIYSSKNNLLVRDSIGNPYWFKFIPDKKTVYFKFSEVVNKSAESFSDFSSRLFKFINDNNVSKLVIDIRENGGGNTMLLPGFFKYLLQCDKINKKGKLFCLIGKKTFSAAQNFSDYLELYTNVIMAGEPTGSSPNFIGEVNFFKLPYSQISCNISNLNWQVSYPEDNRIWTTPLIYYEPTFKEVADNKDTLLESILDMK